MAEIMRIAKEHNPFVVEDACQAHLAKIDGKRVGTFGNAEGIPMGSGYPNDPCTVND